MTVHIVLQGHAPRVPEAVSSLETQTFRAFQTVIADAGVTDRGSSWLDGRSDVVVLRSHAGRNVCRAENDLLALAATRWADADTRDRYVLFVKQDVWLDADCLGALVRAFERDDKLQFACPFLARAAWSYEDDGGVPERTAEGTLDAAGLMLGKGRRPVFRLRDTADGEVVSEVVFGFPFGACMVRASALPRLALDGEWFDTGLHPEAATVDLAWRAALLGMKTVVVGDARVWVRTQPLIRKSPIARVLAWYGREARHRRVAEADWKMLRLKNDLLLNALWHAPWAVPHVLRRVGEWIADPVTAFRSLATFARLPAAWRRRRLLMGKRTASADDLWHIFV